MIFCDRLVPRFTRLSVSNLKYSCLYSIVDPLPFTVRVTSMTEKYKSYRVIRSRYVSGLDPLPVDDPKVYRKIVVECPTVSCRESRRDPKPREKPLSTYFD